MKTGSQRRPVLDLQDRLLPCHDSMHNAVVIKLHPDDNVATALADVASGEHYVLRHEDGQQSTDQCCEAIAFGHKIALCDISEQQAIIKYGSVIGVASTTIRAGTWVHVHNCHGCRGRTPCS